MKDKPSDLPLRGHVPEAGQLVTKSSPFSPRHTARLHCPGFCVVSWGHVTGKEQTEGEQKGHRISPCGTLMSIPLYPDAEGTAPKEDADPKVAGSQGSGELEAGVRSSESCPAKGI